MSSMTGKNPGLSVKSVTAMGILLVLYYFRLLHIRLASWYIAQTHPSEVRPLTILKSNNTILDHLSDAGLTLGDGTNVLNAEPTSDPSTDAVNDATSSVSDSTADSSAGRQVQIQIQMMPQLSSRIPPMMPQL